MVSHPIYSPSFQLIFMVNCSLKDSETLVEQGWKEGNLVNAMVLSIPK